MSNIVLTPLQISRLHQISTMFENVTEFTIIDERTSGIGPTISIKFRLYNEDDTTIDITDYSTW